MYDVNPSNDNKNILSINITEYDNSQTLDLALEVCEYFNIKPEVAKNIITDMKKQVLLWKSVAKTCGISKSETDKMESAFKV